MTDDARRPENRAGSEAGAHAVDAVPRAAPDARVVDVRAGLAGSAFDSAVDVVVVAADRPVGLVPVERLLSADEDTVLAELAQPAVTIGAGEDLEVAARRAAAEGGRSVVVVDDAARFAGLVPPEALLRLLEREHEEDMARLGGFLSGTSAARTAFEERVTRRLWHRIPWLGLGLAGAMSSAAVVAGFEEKLQEQVLLAFFLPAVVYMADAVGTQTETVVIRGMSAGVALRDVVARELATGLVVGALAGAAFFPFAFAIWGDAGVAATVALALFVSCSVATVVAMALPAALSRLGRDPAFGSGPLATVIQDLLSIIAYFGVATVLA